MKPKPQKLFDVVIVECETRVVQSVAGRDLPRVGSFHTVDKRIETVLSRINDQFFATEAPAGRFKAGDVFSEPDIRKKGSRK